MALVLTLNVIVCIGGMLLCLHVIRRQGRLLLLPITLLILLASNGLFQGAQSWGLVSIEFPTDPLMFQRALAVDAILVACAALPLMAFAQLSKAPTAVSSSVSLAALSMLFIGCCVVIIYFTVRNREIFPLSASLYRASDYREYIALRDQIGAIINSHSLSGNGPMNWAFSVICPTILVLLPDCRELGRNLCRICFALTWALMAVPAYLYGSRAMLIYLLAFPLVAYAIRKVDWRHWNRKLLSLWKQLTAGAVAGVVVFQAIYHGSFLEAVVALAARIVIIPSATSAIYYLAFPEILPFRGWRGVLMMPIATDTIDYYDIARIMTNLDASANASFAATAYSGAGIPGVAAASLVVVALAAVMDLVLIRAPISLANSLVISSMFGIFSLGSAPALVAIMKDGFVLAPALVLAFMWMFRGSRFRAPFSSIARPAA